MTFFTMILVFLGYYSLFLIPSIIFGRFIYGYHPAVNKTVVIACLHLLLFGSINILIWNFIEKGIIELHLSENLLGKECAMDPITIMIYSIISSIVTAHSLCKSID